MPPHSAAERFNASTAISRTGDNDASLTDGVSAADERHSVTANAMLHNLRAVDTITTAEKQPAAVDADGGQRGSDD